MPSDKPVSLPNFTGLFLTFPPTTPANQLATRGLPRQPSRELNFGPLSPLSCDGADDFDNSASNSAKPVSVRRSTRQAADEKILDDINGPGAWTKDVSTYLYDVFAKSPFKTKIVEGFLAIEAAMGYPTGKVSISTILV